MRTNDACEAKPIQARRARDVAVRTVGGRLFLSYLAVVVVGLLAASVAMSGILVRYENDTIQLRLTELSAPLLTAMTSALRQGQQPREVIDSLAEQAKSAD